MGFSPKFPMLAAAAVSCVLTLGACGAPADDANTDQPQATQEAAQSQDGDKDSADGATQDNTGKTVKVNYRGTLEDGTQFDSSYDRGEPLEFTVGSGQMISGFDEAVRTMAPGEKKTVTLEPSEAYGERDNSLVLAYDKSKIQDADQLKVGDQIVLTNSSGQQIPATVTSVEGTQVVVDANHELAGKKLTFEIELVEVED